MIRPIIKATQGKSLARTTPALGQLGMMAKLNPQEHRSPENQSIPVAIGVLGGDHLLGP